ncbi:hypothetical protein ASPSYDRAFT_142902 [Aspergillus sydowii CBS 593.65]|uniref:FAD-binding PCMH-type domain-containing protein n=1 Tax=Aspergillus sydowii CBS 593.65 TaxID=1036612 RepID=A0A1L9TSN0_9EURO|nr:uncharacterized protein ASPSYDRAFT_142902 [Aspergillus sydowii CBS 593.65]OJJ62434.1 hypothetical protein ASPSYDRAFT_142902 [Aspergillus sydowii CBS 593.65]
MAASALTCSPETVLAIVSQANEASNSTSIAEQLKKFAVLPCSEKDKVRPLFVTSVFALVFGDNAAVQGSEDYELQRQVPWQVFRPESTNCWLEPRVIVAPTTAQQVAAALALCNFLRTKFSVRGGGHLHNPGFNSNNGGVVISLGKFKQVNLSDDITTADVGLGLTWLDVYKALDLDGLAVTGGRVPTVGIPGLILGGGISFQNSRYGVGAMGVTNYEVVLADTSIVNANAHENPDLFWALKGGGSNFGIVTKIEMATIPNKIWAQATVYPPTAYDQLMKALMQYHDTIETDDQATLIWHHTNQAILLVYVYCSPIEKPAAFAPFYDIPSLMDLVPPGLRTIYDLIQALADVNSPEPMIHDFRTMSSRPSLTVYNAIEEARQEQLAALADLEGVVLTNVFQPMSSLAMKQSANSPLGLDPVGQQWFLATGDYKDPSHEPRVREALKRIVDVAEETAEKEGALVSYKYVNYASRDQDALASYGSGNIQRLKEVAMKYDPSGVFQDLQAGGWLLSRVGSGPA